MNRKTKKFELFLILCIIILDTISKLKSQVSLILELNALNDQIIEYKIFATYKYLTEKITADQYKIIYSLINETGTAIENTKDYFLASIATHISQLTIIIDLIFRPFEQV
jgi:hypothetical protein